MSSLTQILDGYVDLLAMQYRDKPNARAHTKLFLKQALGDFLAREMLTCFGIDTAVGAQMDVIAKYIGVDRKQNATLTEDFFGFWDYTVVDDNDQNPRGFNFYESSDSSGFTPAAFGSTVGTGTTEIIVIGTPTYWTGDLIVDGTLIVDDTLIASAAPSNDYRFLSYQFSGQDINLLPDAQMALLLRLKIIINTTDNTLYSINNYLTTFFGTSITVVDNKDMTLTYTVGSDVTLDPSVLEQYLPKPMGVAITVNYL